jgi:hypothetical protein
MRAFARGNLRDQPDFLFFPRRYEATQRIAADFIDTFSAPQTVAA